MTTKDVRNSTILARIDTGETFATVAQDYGVSAKRVEQICHRMAWLQRVERRQDAPKACEPGCPGWGIYNLNEIQRCDLCNRWYSDEEAADYVLAQMGA